MKGFKLSDLLGEQTPATATTGGEWDIQHIPLDQITPAKNNNYRICDIEALADSIEIDGLMTPLLVRELPGGGRYELISGERRYTALKLLRDKGADGYGTAPCKVESNVSDLMAEIKLIHANSTTRVLSDQEKVNQAARLAELFRQLRSSGVKVQGRKREFVAGMLGVSSAQVGRMESVDKNLVPDAKAEFQQGSMNFSTAYEASLLPADQQQQVVDDLRQGEKVDIKAVKQRRQPAAAPPAAMPPYAPGAPLNRNAEPSRSQPLVTSPSKKVYVASSWRNNLQPEVVKHLRKAGYDVYDFKNPRPGDNGFHWSEIDPEWKDWEPQQFINGLGHPIAQRGFDSDMTALIDCDICVLVLPCGRSAHIEAGHAAGAGKKVYILIPEKSEPELMYKMTAGQCTDIDGLLSMLESEG